MQEANEKRGGRREGMEGGEWSGMLIGKNDNCCTGNSSQSFELMQSRDYSLGIPYL